MDKYQIVLKKQHNMFTRCFNDMFTRHFYLEFINNSQTVRFIRDGGSALPVQYLHLHFHDILINIEEPLVKYAGRYEYVDENIEEPLVKYAGRYEYVDKNIENISI
jgi:hypothetical protein